MIYQSANEAWLSVLRDVMTDGQESKPRDMRVRELVGYSKTMEMSRPVVSVSSRKLSRKFLAAEALWILSGDNRVSTISKYNSVIANFSDDGTYFAGAYGPRVVDQLSYVVDNLVKDHDSRQAVMTIWRSNPRPSKDIPCTVAIQFLLRPNPYTGDDEVHCVDTMRSSDAWLGWPYDVFNFSMLSAIVALMYKHRTGSSLGMGTLTLQAGSQHLYDRNWDAVNEVRNAPAALDYRPFDLSEFGSPAELMEHLESVRDNVPGKASFMAEFLDVPKCPTCDGNRVVRRVDKHLGPYNVCLDCEKRDSAALGIEQLVKEGY